MNLTKRQVKNIFCYERRWFDWWFDLLSCFNYVLEYNTKSRIIWDKELISEFEENPHNNSIRYKGQVHRLISLLYILLALYP